MVKAILDTFIEIKDTKHYSKYQQENPNKINDAPSKTHIM